MCLSDIFKMDLPSGKGENTRNFDSQSDSMPKALDKRNGQLISQFFTLSLSEGVILQLLRCDFHSSGLQSSLSVMCQPI